MVFTTVEVVKTKENGFYIEWDLQPDPTTTTTTPGPGTTTTTIPAPGTTTTTTAAPTYESIDDYNFQIHWAKDPASGFLPVLDNTGTPIEIDGAIGPLSYTHTLLQYDFNQDRYYKILAINKYTLEEFFSQTVFIGNYFDGVHDTMRYAESVLYNYYTGEPCLIIKKKTFGARCPNCWSNERQQMVKSHCTVCNGSGYATGFYQPIRTQISFDSDPKKSDSQKEFENVFDTKRGRISNYPLVRPKDIIVNIDDNKRYVITHVETTKLPHLSAYHLHLSKQNYIVSQLLIFEELNTDDNEYNIDTENIQEIPITDEGNTGGTKVNKRYYGSSANTTLTNSEILALNKESCVAITNTHDYNCTGGKYIWICYPSSFGLAKFTVNGLQSTFDLTVKIVTDETNYSESYNCYKSYRLQHGTTITVAVT